jgi:hypothetical protein
VFFILSVVGELDGILFLDPSGEHHDIRNKTNKLLNILFDKDDFGNFDKSDCGKFIIKFVIK